MGWKPCLRICDICNVSRCCGKQGHATQHSCQHQCWWCLHEVPEDVTHEAISFLFSQKPIMILQPCMTYKRRPLPCENANTRIERMHPNKMFTIQITKNTCSFKTVSTREKQKYSHGAGGAHKTTRTSYFEGCANAACKEQWSDIVHPPSSD